MANTTSHTRKNAVVVYDSQDHPRSPFHRFVGGCCVSLFLSTWLASVASPALLAISWTHGWYLSAGTIVGLSTAAYWPWKHGTISRWWQRILFDYHYQFYKSLRIVMKGSQLPSLEKDRPTLYAIHPHGVYCIGWSCLFSLPCLRHVRFCFAPLLYASPFFRLFTRLCGTPGSASKSSMKAYMNEKQHLGLLPGGFEEATLSCTEQDRVFLKKRTGFIRLCLQAGYAVRPVYVFGEKDLFWNIQGGLQWRLAANRYSIPTIGAWGSWWDPLLPRSTVDVAIVIGEALQMPRIEQPSQQDVKQWHERYVTALVQLFEEHKEWAYGVERAKTTKLELW